MKSPVELTNCVVKHSRQGQGFEVMLKSTSQINKSCIKLDMDAIMASTVETKLITLDMLQTLPQYEKVSVHVKVLSLLKAEQVGQENKIKRDVILAEPLQKLFFGRNTWIHSKKESLKHFHVKDFKSKKHLSIPKRDFEISLINDLEDAVVDLPPDDEHTIINDVQIIGGYL